jgi:hypothetical protein
LGEAAWYLGNSTGRINKRPIEPTRPEAIRRLVELGLRVKK